MSEELSPELQKKAKHWAAIVKLVRLQNPAVEDIDPAGEFPNVFHHVAYTLCNNAYSFGNPDFEAFRKALVQELDSPMQEGSAGEELTPELKEKMKQLAAIVWLVKQQNHAVEDTEVTHLLYNVVLYVGSLSREAFDKSHGAAFLEATYKELELDAQTQDRSAQETASDTLKKFIQSGKPSTQAADVTVEKTPGQDNPR